MRELNVPPGISSDPKARELARVWAAHGEQHVTLDVEAWGNDAGNWGILLVDLARHVARAHHELYGTPEHDSLTRIRELFDAEWERPTDPGRGSVI
jgi:uncharacterized protein DUF5076